MKLWKIKADIRRIVIDATTHLYLLPNMQNGIVNEITNKIHKEINDQANQHMVDFLRKTADKLESDINDKTK